MDWNLHNGEIGPTGVNWDERLRLGAPVDPYLVWADATKFRLLLVADPDNVPFAVEIADVDAFMDARRQASPDFPAVPSVYASHARVPRFCTCRVAVTGIGALLRNALFRRVQLGLPRGTGFQADIIQDISCLSLTDRTFIGVIDDGCAFAHPALREKSGATSRVVALWDQGAVPEQMPGCWKKAVKALGYGAELDFNAFAQSGLVGDADFYRRTGYAALLRKRQTHGCGVVDLVAGWPAPRVAERGEARQVVRDVAADTPVLFVQLPPATIADTSGGSLGVHILEGIQYIIYRAERYETGKVDRNCRIVVNISFGALAGPHDGSSIVEEAMTELIALRNGKLDIVVAAGNSRKSAGHVELCFGAGAPRRAIQWLVPPDNPQQSFAEIWLPEDERKFTVALSGPGFAAQEVTIGHAASLRDAAGAVVASVVFASKVVQGRNGTMALLAVAPTRTGNGSCAPHGIWRIGLSYEGSGTARAQVWVERNDLVVGTRRRRQARLLADAETEISEGATQSSLASGEGLWIATASQLLNGKPAPYSADVTDPARGPIPSVSAPVDFSSARRGIRVVGISPAATARISGTSAAAPRLARALVNAKLGGSPATATPRRALTDDLDLLP